MERTRMFGKINQRGITWKLRKGEQSFLCATGRPDQIYIPIKLHEDIRNCYSIMEHTRMFAKINPRGITLKLRKREQSFLCASCLPDRIHIPVKMHEDIVNCY